MRGKEIHQVLQTGRCDHVFHATSGAGVKHSKMGIAASEACVLKVLPLLLEATGQKQKPVPPNSHLHDMIFQILSCSFFSKCRKTRSNCNYFFFKGGFFIVKIIFSYVLN